MHFTSTVVALAALASAAIAQDTTPGFDPIKLPSVGQLVPQSAPFDITWQSTVSDTVTIYLMQGDSPGSLHIVDTPIASNVSSKNEKVTWAVPKAGFKTYGIKLVLDSNNTCFQYSDAFNITDGSSTSGTVTLQISSASGYTSTSTAVDTTTTPTFISTIANSTTSSASATFSPSSNLTILTTVTPTKTGPSATGNSVSTTSGAPTTTKSSSAAAANMVSGGLAAVGGLAIAFML